MCGVPVDLSQLTLPVYVYASREDHIVPWRSAYRTTRLVGGDVDLRARRVGAHRGRRQPADATRKRNYWTNDLVTDDAGRLARARAQSVPGSWWPHWAPGLRGGGRRGAEGAGAPTPPLEPAPGR